MVTLKCATFCKGRAYRQAHMSVIVLAEVCMLMLIRGAYAFMRSQTQGQGL